MAEEKKNNVATVGEVKLNNGTQLQVTLINELDKGLEEMGAKFTDYGKQCVINAIAGLVTTCKNQKISFNDLDPTLLRLQLQNVGLTELNFNAYPPEVFVDLRKNTVKDKEGNAKEVYAITIKPQGAGNEKLVRKFGVNLKELKPCWLVREGDEFTLGSFDGINQTPPTWVRKSLSAKVIMVVYPVITTNGVEYLMADRDSVKTNLIAQIRQNALYKFKKDVEYNGRKYQKTDEEARDSFYANIEKDFEGKTLDEVLAMPEYADYINPTYTSGGSKESMIVRKMKNNALKNYPREYDTNTIKEAVVGMFEDSDDTVLEPAKAVRKDVADIVDAEIKEPVASDDAPQDFDVDDDGVVTKPEEKVEETTTEESSQQNNKDYDNMF